MTVVNKYAPQEKGSSQFFERKDRLSFLLVKQDILFLSSF